MQGRHADVRQFYKEYIKQSGYNLPSFRNVKHLAYVLHCFKWPVPRAESWEHRAHPGSMAA